MLVPGPADADLPPGGIARTSFGDRVRFDATTADDPANGIDGAVYEYIGSSPTPVDLSAEDYNDGSSWRQLQTADFEDLLFPDLGNLTDSDSRAYGALIVYNELRGDVTAYIADGSVTTSDGDVSVLAVENARLLVDSESNVASSGGSFLGTGTSLAINGQLGTNVLLSEATAYIDEATVDANDADGSDADDLGHVKVEAHDTAVLDATTSSAGSSGDTAYTFTLAFNTVGWKPQNFLFNSIDAILGDPLVSSAFGGSQPALVSAYIVDSTVTADADIDVSASNEVLLNATTTNAADSAASALFNASGRAIGGMLSSNRVNSLAQAYIKDTDQSGTTSAAAGGDVSVRAVDDAGIYSNTKVVSSSITTNDGGAAVLQETLNDLLPADYESDDGGNVDLEYGRRVRLADDFAGPGGNPGSVYMYLGNATDGADSDLSLEDYSDLDFWFEVPETQLIPQGLNVTDSDSLAVGGSIVLNDLRGAVEAYVQDAGLTAADGNILIEAIEQATLRAIADNTSSSSGGSAFGSGDSIAVNGTIATNSLLSSANAWAEDATLAATDADPNDSAETGDIIVSALNDSSLKASTLATTSTGDTGVTVVLAFNTVGWNPQNFLFGTLDALLGGLISESLDLQNPAAVEARITDSDVTASRDVIVEADTSSNLTATLSNSSTAAASALYGASSTAASAALATNKLSSSSKAYIDNAGAASGEDVGAGRNVTVSADDSAEIDASNEIEAIATTENLAGLSQLADFAETLLNEYQYSTKSGQQDVKTGEKIRIASDYDETKGTREALYRYEGEDASFDLGSHDFGADDDWVEIDPTDFSTIIPGSEFLRLNFSDSDAVAVGTLISLNEVRGAVESYVKDAVVTSTAGTVAVSADELAQIVADVDSTIVSDGGSITGSGASTAVGAVIATNVVLSDAYAHVTDATISTLNSGNIEIGSTNASIIAAELDNSATSKGVSVGVTLAFNNIGIAPQNFLFDAVDALFGADIADNDPASVRAKVENSQLAAKGSVEVTAEVSADIDATIGTSTSAINASLGGSETVAVSAVIAMNKIATSAEATVDGDESDGADLVKAGTGRVLVQATGAGNVDAMVSAPSVAIGLSLGTDSDPTVSVALAVARNEVDSNVDAHVADARVEAATGVELVALSDTTIHADTTASALGLSVSGGKSLSLSAAGSLAFNEIVERTQAYISGSDSVETATGDIRVEASNDAAGDASDDISATVSAPTVAIAASASGATVAATIGLSVSTNEIDSEVDAWILDSGSTATPIEAADGDVIVKATQGAEIDVTASASAIAVAGSFTGAAPAIGGGGAVALNDIEGGATASIRGSSVQALGSDGDVEVVALNSGDIEATVAAAALSVSLSGGGTAAGLAIGAAVAHNQIGNSAADPFRAHAYLLDSDVVAEDGISIRARSDAQIDATVLAAAMAVGASGSSAGGGAGAGVDTTNEIYTSTHAWIEGAGSQGVVRSNSGGILVEAEDVSQVTATAGAAAVAASLAGSNALGISVGVSLALNEIHSDVSAHASNVGDLDAGGLLTLHALNDATIDATSIAAAVTVSGSGSSSLAFAGGGAESTNAITGAVEAYVEASKLTAGGNVAIDADMGADIEATVLGVAASGGIGGSNGIAAAIGVALASSRVGFDKNGNKSAFGVHAYSLDSIIDSDGDLEITATADAEIDTLVLAGSAAIGGGGTTGVALGGSGVKSINEIALDVKAYIDGDGDGSDEGVHADAITLAAEDLSHVLTDAGAASLAGSVGGTGGVSAAIGVSLASNRIENVVEAYIVSADDVDATVGGIDIDAKSDGQIDATAIAAAVSLAGGGTFGVGLAGGGAEATNVILTDTRAYVQSSYLFAEGDVAVDAQSTGVIKAEVLGVAGSIAVSGTAGVSSATPSTRPRERPRPS
ncbi:MAG: hypothetical protein AMS20_13940 [Gemmatimonas sp. SG8_28]|nr:MAG: hypothetical protein AMS20_13940 [Gemmatimonas sp. SG8_28]